MVVLNFFFIDDVSLLRVLRILVQRNPKLDAVQIGDGGRHAASNTSHITAGIVAGFIEAPVLRVLVIEMNYVAHLKWEELCELSQPLCRRCILFRFSFGDTAFGHPSVYVE